LGGRFSSGSGKVPYAIREVSSSSDGKPAIGIAAAALTLISMANLHH